MFLRQVFLVALAIAGSLQGGASECPPDALWFDASTCFLVHNGWEHSWAQAAQLCRSKGMRLASIHSEAENDFISDLVYDVAWIGLYDEGNDDKFRWSDETDLDYENWDDGEPDGGEEDCAYMDNVLGQWWDDKCTWKQGVVCRGSPQHVLD